MSVHLQNHMHVASAFLSHYDAHRIQGTFTSMHVIISGRRFMCMRSRLEKIQRKVGYMSLINLQRRQSKTVGCQVVEMNLSKQKIYIPLVVAEDAVCPQTLKDRLVAALR